MRVCVMLQWIKINRKKADSFNTGHRGSYMSAHVLLNLLNKLGKKIRCKALPSILSVFPNEFNKFSNTGA